MTSAMWLCCAMCQAAVHSCALSVAFHFLKCRRDRHVKQTLSSRFEAAVVTWRLVFLLQRRSSNSNNRRRQRLRAEEATCLASSQRTNSSQRSAVSAFCSQPEVFYARQKPKEQTVFQSQSSIGDKVGSTCRLTMFFLFGRKSRTKRTRTFSESTTIRRIRPFR